jgi:hydroxymethylglutaryl-CoA lyase
MSGMVRVTEVGPRDGLQNERAQVPVADKVAFVNALIAAGFHEVELTIFVSPKLVPHLADGAEVISEVDLLLYIGNIYSLGLFFFSLA